MLFIQRYNTVPLTMRKPMAPLLPGAPKPWKVAAGHAPFHSLTVVIFYLTEMTTTGIPVTNLRIPGLARANSLPVARDFHLQAANVNHSLLTNR